MPNGEYWIAPRWKVTRRKCIDAGYNEDSIFNATWRCLYDEDFRELSQKAENPYWLGDAGPKIADVLASLPLDQRIIRKRMTLKGETHDGWYR